MQIQPTTNVLASWMTSYIPDKDFFFLTEEQYSKVMNHLDILAIPIDEFFSHSTYSQIHYMNSYEYWNIKYAKYVIVAESNWIEQLSKEEKKFILTAQVQCKRGMTVPISFIHNIKDIPVDYIQNGHVVLQRTMWENLNPYTKEKLLLRMVYEWWDKGECQEVPVNFPNHIHLFANTFGKKQGANCLAAVLYAITEGKNPWLIHEWIHQQTFLEKLKQCQYQIVKTNKPNKGDVVIWQDENENIRHAAYCIEENLFFNKHGQTIFNPWKLLSTEQLNKEWGSLKQFTYRRVQPNQHMTMLLEKNDTKFNNPQPPY